MGGFNVVGVDVLTMADPTLGVVLPFEDDYPHQEFKVRQSGVKWGERIEELGYDSIWIGESWSTNPFIELALIADHTDSLMVGTSVINVFSRSPAVIAMGGTTLQRISNGRAMLGVGASHPEYVEDLHSQTWERPIRRVEETIQVITELTSPGGGKVEFEGEIFEIAGFKSTDTELPIYNSGLGRINRRITGMLCDGWIPYHIPLPKLDDAFEIVAQGARDANRDPEKITAAPWIPAAVSDNPDEALDTIRHNLIRYLQRFEDDVYQNAIGQMFPDTVESIVHSEDLERAMEYVTDEMVRAIGVAGTPEDARNQLNQLIDNTIIDMPILYVPYGAREGIVDRTIEELSPEYF
jgi:5,10-methylenetetrahydromethanopterin reductase